MEKNEEIKKTVQEILSQIINLPAEQINFNKPLADIPNIDSICMLQFLVALEREFNVIIGYTDMDQIFYNIKSIADYIINNIKHDQA